MHKKFRLTADQIEPWALVLHRVSVLDTAAKIAEMEGDVESLIEISQHVAAASDDLVQIYMLLTGEEEEESGEKPKQRVGFIHEPKSDAGPCECEENR